MKIPAYNRINTSTLMFASDATLWMNITPVNAQKRKNIKSARSAARKAILIEPARQHIKSALIAKKNMAPCP